SRQGLLVATTASLGVAPRPENGKSRADPAARDFSNDLAAAKTRENATMNEAMQADARPSTGSDERSDLLKQYGCGPIQFSGTDDGLYERHLLFDDVVTPASAGPYERYRAVARSVRDVLSQRWVRTETTYERENPKRVYYMPMEFLIGQSLSHNSTNSFLDPVAKRPIAARYLDCLGLIDQI